MQTVSAQYYKSVFKGCIEAGCSADTLGKLAGKTPASLINPTERIEANFLIDLLHSAEDVLGRKGIGIDVGQSFRPNTFLDIGYGSIYCASIIDAINFNKKYQRLTQEIGVTHIEVHGDASEIIWEPHSQDDEYLRPLTDCVYGGYITVGLWMAWLNVGSVKGRLEFKHKAVNYRERFEQAFNCDVHFEGDRNALVFPTDVATKPFPQHNPELCKIVSERLDRLLLKLSSKSSISEISHRIIESRLSEKSLSVQKLAKVLGKTDRTFRRDLANEGTSYRQIVENVRKETCQILIYDKNISLADVAYRLGYSDQSAFSRAFVEWFGNPPGQYRKNLSGR